MRKRKLFKRHWVTPRHVEMSGEASLGNWQKQMEAEHAES